MSKGEYLQYGGQAVVEGVMMRSPNYFSVACRAPDDEIIVQTEPLTKTWIGRQKWLKKPFLRGVLALLDAMVLGYKSMRFASEIQLDEKYEEIIKAKEAAEKEGKVYNPKTGQVENTSAEDPREGLLGQEQMAKPTETSKITQTDEPNSKINKGDKSDKIGSMQIGFALFLGFGLGLVLFTFLPNLLSEQLRAYGASGTLINFVTELIKITFFIGYMWLISKIPDIRRVFQYHGAEHKAINAMEAKQELTIQNCLDQTRLHPRCGTSFAIVVLIVSMFCFTFVPRYPLGETLPVINVCVRFWVELLILPFIAGFSYEAIQLAGRMRNQQWVMSLFKPGLMTQYLTTVEPDKHQTEVALVALKAVIDAEEKDRVKKEIDELAEEKSNAQESEESEEKPKEEEVTDPA